MSGFQEWAWLSWFDPSTASHSVAPFVLSMTKVMAMEKCNRIEAQGNMDAYLENAQGTECETETIAVDALLCCLM